MKILMINHFPLAGSGSGTNTKNLAVQLAAKGHEVTIVLPENTTDYEEIPGIRLHPVFFDPEEGVLRREEACDLPAWRSEIAHCVREEYGQDRIIHELEELYAKAIG